MKHNGSGQFMYVYQYKDHLGNVRLSYADIDGSETIDSASEILEENNYYPFGLKHQGYNEIANSNRSEAAEKYKYGGKEWNDELGLDLYDFHARNYDPAIGRWLNVDPLAEKYPNYGGYIYTLNNPIMFVDPDGRDPIIWVVGNDKTGHTFMTVGEGKTLTVYTYGRYLGGNKDKSSGNSLDPKGKGVMLKLTGADAQCYLDTQKNIKKARGYKVEDVSEERVINYFEKVFNNGQKLNKQESTDYDNNPKQYGSSEDARIIDEYSLMSNNCTTFILDGVKEAGTKEDFKNRNNEIKTPFSLMLYLEKEINSGNSNIKVKTDEP